MRSSRFLQRGRLSHHVAWTAQTANGICQTSKKSIFYIILYELIIFLKPAQGDYSHSSCITALFSAGLAQRDKSDQPLSCGRIFTTCGCTASRLARTHAYTSKRLARMHARTPARCPSEGTSVLGVPAVN